MPFTPSCGTMITAALETAGYTGQSQVLEQLGSTLISLGSFTFLCSLVYGLTMLIVQGAYKPVRWLLIGPTFFLFLIYSTTVGHGASWQFGTHDRHGDDEVRAFLKLDFGQLGR